MKRTLRKAAGFLLILVMVFAVCACGTKTDESADEKQTAFIESCENFIVSFAGLSQEELQTVATQGDFYGQAVQMWQESQEELGAFISVNESQYSVNGGVITIVSDVKFENKNADVTITLLEETGEPTSFNVEIEKTMGEKMEQAGMNTVLGIGIVFFILIFLTFIISLFRFIGEKEKKPEETVQPVPVGQTEPMEAQIEQADDKELIAVIAAAIAAYEGASADDFVVRSVKKVRKSSWKRA